MNVWQIKKSYSIEVNLRIGHAFALGFLKVKENQEAFSALSHIGMLLSLPLIIRHPFELLAAINYSEQCLQKLLDKKLNESEKASLNKKGIKFVAGTKLPENLLPEKNSKNPFISLIQLENWRKKNGKKPKIGITYEVNFVIQIFFLIQFRLECLLHMTTEQQN